MGKIIIIADTMEQGLGNIVMQLSLIKLFQLNKMEFNLYVKQQRVKEFLSLLFQKDNINIVDKIEEVYTGQVVLMGSSALPNIPVVNRRQFSPLERMSKSEVECNLLTVADKWPDSVYDCRPMFEHLLEDGPCFDLVVANGANTNPRNPHLWEVKKYPHFEKIAEVYPSKNIACVGAPKEYIKGFIDKTGASFTETINMLHNAKRVITNDTFVSHLFCALRTKGVIIYTATSHDKGYDSKFHQSAQIVRRTDLECSPCQLRGNAAWLSCSHQECRNIPVSSIIA